MRRPTRARAWKRSLATSPDVANDLFHARALVGRRMLRELVLYRERACANRFVQAPIGAVGRDGIGRFPLAVDVGVEVGAGTFAWIQVARHETGHLRQLAFVQPEFGCGRGRLGLRRRLLAGIATGECKYAEDAAGGQWFDRGNGHGSLRGRSGAAWIWKARSQPAVGTDPSSSATAGACDVRTSCPEPRYPCGAAAQARFVAPRNRSRAATPRSGWSMKKPCTPRPSRCRASATTGGSRPGGVRTRASSARSV